MTPIAIERIVRLSLQAILQGSGTIDTRLDEVIGKLSTLPPTDRKRVVRVLRPKLARALRQKSATLELTSGVNANIKTQLDTFATNAGMVTTQEHMNEKLLAGFTLQTGDDRLDLSLRGRLQKFL